MTTTITTTAAEDAAIRQVTGGEAPDAFVIRHVRHQLDYVVSQARLSLDAVYEHASVADQVALDAIRARTAAALTAGNKSPSA